MCFFLFARGDQNGQQYSICNRSKETKRRIKTPGFWETAGLLDPESHPSNYIIFIVNVGTPTEIRVNSYSKVSDIICFCEWFPSRKRLCLFLHSIFQNASIQIFPRLVAFDFCLSIDSRRVNQIEVQFDLFH